VRLNLPVSRSRHGLLLATALLAGGAGMVSAAGLPALTDRAALRILTPVSGTEADGQFLLSWTGDPYPSYAVVVDHHLPEPGAAVPPGKNVVLVKATAVLLKLGPKSGGSPSARHHHTVVVVPLDAEGRRVGEQTAVVQVRSRP
jgi:hypothetical protein